MDTEQVKRVVDMVERSQLHEVTIVDGAQSIKVVNTSKATSPAECVADSPVKSQDNDDSNSNSTSGKQICAPYVGIVHLSKDGATENLVKVGDTIEQGQTVCYIEELTRLLPVVSEHDGIVSEVLVEHGQGVAYGQGVFNIQ